MTSARDRFKSRILDYLLPQFCDDPSRAWGMAGFRPSWDKITEQDADDFLKALDAGLVQHLGRGMYRAARSKASEQLFWSGGRDIVPRPISIWIEPIITIAVLARLHFRFGWPIDLLGTQSDDWAFDAIAFQPNNLLDEHIACEVKKTRSEADYLIEAMILFGNQPEQVTAEKLRNKDINALRKVLALKKRRPPVFWVVGPDAYGQVFCVKY